MSVDSRQLLDLRVPDGEITEAGVRANISIGIQYIESWLRGTGAAAIFNLMEDAATAEISRSQVWQWIHHGATLERRANGDARAGASSSKKKSSTRSSGVGATVAATASTKRASCSTRWRLSEHFVEFLTLPAYEHID